MINGVSPQKPEKKLDDVTDSEKAFGVYLEENSKVEGTIVYYLSFLRCPQSNTQGFVFLSCRIMDQEGFLAQRRLKDARNDEANSFLCLWGIVFVRNKRLAAVSQGPSQQQLYLIMAFYKKS